MRILSSHCSLRQELQVRRAKDVVAIGADALNKFGKAAELGRKISVDLSERLALLRHAAWAETYSGWCFWASVRMNWSLLKSPLAYLEASRLRERSCRGR